MIKEKILIYTKVICELGINHNGSIKVCKQLIKLAHESGSWGIKFQYRNLKSYFADYKNQTELGKEIIDKALRKNYLSPKQIKSLNFYAKKLGLKTGISFFTCEDIRDFNNFKFDFYKIPSAASDNKQLLKKILNLKKLTLISLGGRSLNSIKQILSNIPNIYANRVALLHCVSNYPVNIINSKLGFIDVIKKNFKKYLIGYSSHDKQIYNCIYALSKKIDFIERHITLNTRGRGLDHSSSSEFNEFKILNFYCKNLNVIDNQNSKKEINQGEIINLQNLGSSYIFNRDIKKGEVLNKKFLKLSQPKVGIDDLTIDKYLGLRIKRDITKNTPLTSNCFYKDRLNKNHLSFINSKKISIPIRPHDYHELINEINSNYYELHLSYKDANTFNKRSLNKDFIKKNYFSVHAPDYIDENNILDLFSKNQKIKKKSLRLLKKCIQICKYINDISKFDTKLIVSISSNNNNRNKEIFYRKVLNLVNQIKKKDNIKILPQWLPVYAWYFGGSEKLEIFSNPLDLKILSKIGLKICLDTSHFLLSCNYYKLNSDKIFFQNLKIYDHYHLSDAKGTDGEGVKLGSGVLFKTKFLNYILNQKMKIIVLETWQGHINGGLGFKKDIKTLYLKNNVK
jgi:sialic acid synthase SpsE/endonuclease IV